MTSKHRWIVQKCKRKSRRWVAWRVRSKKKTGIVFDTWLQAFTYAHLQSGVDAIMANVSGPLWTNNVT